MADFNKIKQMIEQYEINLAEHNVLWKAEGLSLKVRASSDLLDYELSIITDEIAEPFHNLMRGMINAGIEIKGIDLVEYNPQPHHSIWMKIGAGGYISKHIVIEEFPYHKHNGI
jgi:hypothetical protein